MDDEQKPPQLLALLKKSQAFAERLLKENEQLHLKHVAAEERLRAAERERDGLRQRIEEVQLTSSVNSQRFAEIDEELNALANLHVATWQLHSTMKLSEVVAVMVEICVNLVGADEVVFFMHDEARKVLVPVTKRASGPVDEVPLGQGVIGTAVTEGKVAMHPEQEPCVVIPLVRPERAIGAVVIYRLLPHKQGFTDLDHQLFEVIGGQGAIAVYGAYLAGASIQSLSAETFRQQL